MSEVTMMSNSIPIYGKTQLLCSCCLPQLYPYQKPKHFQCHFDTCYSIFISIPNRCHKNSYSDSLGKRSTYSVVMIPCKNRVNMCQSKFEKKNESGKRSSTLPSLLGTGNQRWLIEFSITGACLLVSDEPFMRQ